MAEAHREPSEPTASPEDAFLKDEAMLFGQDVPPVAEEQSTTPPNPAPETADVSDVVDGMGGMAGMNHMNGMDPRMGVRGTDMDQTVSGAEQRPLASEPRGW